MCSSTATNLAPSISPPLASKLVENVRQTIKQALQNKATELESPQDADILADQLLQQLLTHPSMSGSNGLLDESRQRLIRSFPHHSLTAIRLAAFGQGLQGMLDSIQVMDEQSAETFHTIISHHRALTSISWEDATSDSEALARYSESAARMGQRVWVRDSNAWMASYITSYFLHGGAMKQYYKAKGCSSDGMLRNLMLIPAEQVQAQGPGPQGPGQAVQRKIRVLDVGSCYNPLQSTDASVHMDITAVDLYPQHPSVFACDFLSLRIGAPDSAPVITVDPQQPQFQQIQQLPGESFDAITMSLVLSYLPSPVMREQMVAKARALLRPASSVLYDAGILVIIEKESIFHKVRDDLHAPSALLSAWKQSFLQQGYEIVKYSAMNAGKSDRKTHTFVVKKSTTFAPVLPADLQGMWIKQDFDTAFRQARTAEAAAGHPAEQVTTAPFSIHHAPVGHPLHAHIHPIGIIGGGIAGCALAVALQKQKLPFILFEKDINFAHRRQGYALTIQQAAAALNALGLASSALAEGATSMGHYSFDQHGRQIGAYGPVVGVNKAAPKEAFDGHLYDKKWVEDHLDDPRRVLSRHNIHIPRQRLRQLMLEQIHPQHIQWDKRFTSFTESSGVEVQFADESSYALSALVGADGIFSAVRKFLCPAPSISNSPFDLTYLHLMVILGIAPVRSSHDGQVLCARQWLDGQTRIFTMPFDKDWSMWQMSFPMSEADALAMSSMGGVGEKSNAESGRLLKEEALRRCAGWDPILVNLLHAADENAITGHPVYDRNLEGTGVPVSAESCVTLIGDAAHPMSPFKGQGANQALLDALHLSKALPNSVFAAPGRRSISEALRSFEVSMADRVRNKVSKSRDAAVYLHSPGALVEADVTRASAAEQAALLL